MGFQLMLSEIRNMYNCFPREQIKASILYGLGFETTKELRNKIQQPAETGLDKKDLQEVVKMVGRALEDYRYDKRHYLMRCWRK